MRRPYNIPFVSIPRNGCRPLFQSFDVVRPFGALKGKGDGQCRFLYGS